MRRLCCSRIPPNSNFDLAFTRSHQFAVDQCNRLLQIEKRCQLISCFGVKAMNSHGRRPVTKNSVEVRLQLAAFLHGRQRFDNAVNACPPNLFRKIRDTRKIAELHNLRHSAARNKAKTGNVSQETNAITNEARGKVTNTCLHRLLPRLYLGSEHYVTGTLTSVYANVSATCKHRYVLYLCCKSVDPVRSTGFAASSEYEKTPKTTTFLTGNARYFTTDSPTIDYVSKYCEKARSSRVPDA